MEPEGSEDMVEEEDFHSESDEVVLVPQEPITRKDIRELVKSWEDKFDKMTEGVRALQMSTNDVHTHLDTVTRESCARESALTSTSGKRGYNLKFLIKIDQNILPRCQINNS